MSGVYNVVLSDSYCCFKLVSLIVISLLCPLRLSGLEEENPTGPHCFLPASTFIAGWFGRKWGREGGFFLSCGEISAAYVRGGKMSLELTVQFFWMRQTAQLFFKDQGQNCLILKQCIYLSLLDNGGKHIRALGMIDIWCCSCVHYFPQPGSLKSTLVPIDKRNDVHSVRLPIGCGSLAHAHMYMKAYTHKYI